MGVDKSYGSGKSRSAANSRARQRAEVAGKRNVGQKKVGNSRAETFKAQRAKLAASPIGQLADTFLGFALPVGKVKAAAMGLQAAGKTAAASAMRARVLAKESGRNLPKTIALAEKMWTRTPGSSAPTPQTVGKTLLGKLPREASESVFPRLPKATPANSRLQKVADTITKRHYADVAKKGIGHGDAVNMPRAQVLRNLKAKRGIQINKPR